MYVFCMYKQCTNYIKPICIIGKTPCCKTEKFVKNICNPSISVNQYLHHNLGHKQKIQVIRRNQVYFSSSNISTDTTVIVKD